MGNVVPEPDQLTLFDLGVDVAKLRAQQAKLMEHHAARNTQSAYASAWKLFTEWCAASGRQPLPASEETLCLYLTHTLEVDRKRVTTAELYKAAIAAMHRASGQRLSINGGVSALLNGARRARAGQEVPRSKKALTIAELRKCVKAIKGTNDFALRDRAILCFGFASGMRRSELVGLDLADIEFRPQGLLVHIRKSKTDQDGRGRDVGLMRHKGKGEDICPVRAVRDWIRKRGAEPGALFWGLQHPNEGQRLNGPAVCSIVQAAVERIGLDRTKYGAHSLRAGLVTVSLAAGASELAVMQRTGHRDVATLQRYVRPATAFAFDPLAAALRAS